MRSKEQNDMQSLLFANILNKVVTMLSNMVITRLLTSEEFGVWSYVLNIYSYLLLISGLGLLSGAFQFGAENRNSDDKYEYYSYCLKIGEIIDAIIVLLFLLFTGFVSFSLPEATPYLRLYMPVLLLEYGLNILLTVFRCESRIKEYAQILNLNTLLLALCTGIGALWGVGGVIAGKYLSFAVAFVLCVYKSRTELKRIAAASPLSSKKQKELWRYSLYTGASSALNTALYLIDVSMVAALIKDPESLALYKVATLIPNALTFIPTSIVLCVLPDIISNRKNIQWLKRKLMRVTCGLGAANMFICGGLILFAPLVIFILSGANYAGAVPAFRILTLGYFFTGTFRMLCTNVLAGMRNVRINLVISAAAIVCDILFNRILIARQGMIGAAYATFGVELLTSAMALIAFLYVLKVRAERGGCDA